MNKVHCPICRQPIEPEPDRKAHLKTHRLDKDDMMKIVLHMIDLEDRIIDLEKPK